MAHILCDFKGLTQALGVAYIRMNELAFGLPAYSHQQGFILLGSRHGSWVNLERSGTP